MLANEGGGMKGRGMWCPGSKERGVQEGGT